jgi:hypothetical protein
VGLRRFLAPIKQFVSFALWKSCYFGMMIKCKILPAPGGFECAAYRSGIHTRLIGRPFPILSLDDGLALTVAATVLPYFF